jgi:hypothetical protein
LWRGGAKNCALQKANRQSIISLQKSNKFASLIVTQVTDFRRNANGTYRAWVICRMTICPMTICHRQLESHEMPMRGELPIAAARPYARVSTTGSAWSRFLAVVSNPDLHLVVGLSAIGLLLTINLILWSSDFSAAVAAVDLFP